MGSRNLKGELGTSLEMNLDKRENIHFYLVLNCMAKEAGALVQNEVIKVVLKV